jgi:hypothetical protein
MPVTHWLSATSRTLIVRLDFVMGTNISCRSHPTEPTTARAEFAQRSEIDEAPNSISSAKYVPNESQVGSRPPSQPAGAVQKVGRSFQESGVWSPSPAAS